MYKTSSYTFCIQWEKGLPFAHLEVHKWGPSVYRELLSLWKTVLAVLRDKGVPSIFSCIPTGDDKLYKFQRMFCLEEIERTDEYVLMYTSTEV